MPLITPVKTLGGLAWWTTVRSDSLLILQQHSTPAIWWGKPFRILLAETKICVATAANKEEALADFDMILRLVEGALPRHLQLTGTALDYENAVLAFLAEYVRRRSNGGAAEESASEELIEESLVSPPMSPSRHDDDHPHTPAADRKKDGPPKLAPAASAPVLGTQTPTPTGNDPLQVPIPPRVDHFIVLVHGINGRVTDMQDFENHLRQLDIFAANTVIFRSAVNQEAGTHQGVEIAGIRLTAEIMEILHRIPHDQTPLFTIAAHSLGGLISRCALGKLEMLGAFNRLRPCTFFTMCTPHLSSRRVGGVFGHYGKAIWQKVVHYFVQTQGETGKELLLADSENGAAPLLVRMTDPDSDYMKALRRFPHPTAIGVAHFDLLVPYASAVMRAHNPHPIPPWNNPNVLSVQDFTNFSEPYLPLFTRYIRRPARPPFLPALDPPPEPTENGFCCDRLHTVEFTAEMFRNLNSIPWRRLEITYGGGPAGLHIHEQVIKCKKHWRAPLLNEATATESVALFTSVIRLDHIALMGSAAPHGAATGPIPVAHAPAPAVGSPPQTPLPGLPHAAVSSPALLAVVQSGGPKPPPAEEKVHAPTDSDHASDANSHAAKEERPKRLIDELRQP